MTNRTVPLSARISHEDAEFLANLSLEGATTPSEKLRVIVSEARQRYEGMKDYRESLLLYQGALNNAIAASRALEMEHGVHSEVLTRIFEWLPDAMAFTSAMGNSLNQTSELGELERFEDGMVERCFRLIQSVLQIGLTETCNCYSEDAVSKRLTPVVDLINKMP